MPRPIPLPEQLAGRAFTTSEANAAGLSKDVLNGRRVQRMHRGVYRYVDTLDTVELRIAAARHLLPPDAALSHTTALWWWGADLGEPTTLHFSTNSGAQTALKNVTLHRREGRLTPTLHRDVPVLGPDRSLVDAATILGHVDLVRCGDRLVRLGVTTPDRLAQFALSSHLDGVVRARRATPFVRDTVDSVKETDVRLMLLHARLPEPIVNMQILGDHGEFLARGDLVYPALKVLVEYDGWHHERDAVQRQKDHLRRERLEAAGWTVIVITAEDLKHPMSVVSRIYAAMVARGFVGPSPVINAQWRTWFVK